MVAALFILQSSAGSFLLLCAAKPFFYSCAHIFLLIFLLTVSIISAYKCEINVYIN